MNNKLTNEELTEIWDSMPGQPGGWLKQFGYMHFARAIQDKLIDRLASPAESSTAGAARGCITSLEGLKKYNFSGSGEPYAIIGGQWLKLSDVECLLAAPTEEGARVVPEGLIKDILMMPAPQIAGFGQDEQHLFEQGYSQARTNAATVAATAQAPQTDELPYVPGWSLPRDLPAAHAEIQKLRIAYAEAIASPAVEGKPAVLTDERIAQINREAQDQAISGIDPAIYFARAIEREVLASQQPQVDSSDWAIIREAIDATFEQRMGYSTKIAAAVRAIGRVEDAMASSLPTVAAGLTKEDGE